MAGGKRVGAGRKKGSPNRVTQAAKDQTKLFFRKILNDKREAEVWDNFITGKETNIISWQAFKRAVEYKRGMPVQPHSGEGGGPIRMIWDIPAGSRSNSNVVS